MEDDFGFLKKPPDRHKLTLAEKEAIDLEITNLLTHHVIEPVEHAEDEFVSHIFLPKNLILNLKQLNLKQLNLKQLNLKQLNLKQLNLKQLNLKQFHNCVLYCHFNMDTIKTILKMCLRI